MLIDAPFNPLTEQILAGAIEVHRVFGPGLIESVYMSCLQRQLRDRNLRFSYQRPVRLVYKGIPLDAGFRADLVVEDTVVVEVKAVATLADVHKAQVLTYVKLLDCPAGLLINFNVARLMDGVTRVINPKHARARERLE